MNSGHFKPGQSGNPGRASRRVQSTVTHVDPRKLSDAELDALIAEEIGEEETPSPDKGEPH